jgi:hypothetical protein
MRYIPDPVFNDSSIGSAQAVRAADCCIAQQDRFWLSLLPPRYLWTFREAFVVCIVTITHEHTDFGVG